MIAKGRAGTLSRAVLGAALALVLAGCASLRNQALLWTRKAGEKLETHPEQVWSDLKCDGKPLPLIDIEREELIPPQVAPGGRLNYRMVYAMRGGPHAGVVQAGVYSLDVIYVSPSFSFRYDNTRTFVVDRE